MSKVQTTRRSIAYRQKAARLARLAEAEPEFEKSLLLLRDALSWIGLAENEEVLAQDDSPHRKDYLS
jgi:hypothetical protein